VHSLTVDALNTTHITTAHTMLAMMRCAVALVTIATALVSNAMVTEGASRGNTTAPAGAAGVCTTVTSVSVTATWPEPPPGIGLIYLGAFDGPDTPGPYAIQTADAAAALGEGGQLSVTMDNLLPNTKCAGHNVQCILSALHACVPIQSIRAHAPRSEAS
jgi:hypothetical protein